MEEYYNDELLKRFRLDREGILFVRDIVREALNPPTNRSKSLLPELKVALTLRCLGTGEMQLCSSDDFKPTQSSDVSRAISQTLNALSLPNIISQFIRFPLDHDIHKNLTALARIARFPGLVGVIDGSTQIRIATPKHN